MSKASYNKHAKIHKYMVLSVNILVALNHKFQKAILEKLRRRRVKSKISYNITLTMITLLLGKEKNNCFSYSSIVIVYQCLVKLLYRNLNVFS